MSMIIDDEFVKVNGVLLDGIFKSIDVSGGALVEEVEIEGKGKKPKQATGYEDCKITIELLLFDDDKKTKLDKLASIQNLFRKSGQTKPTVYSIVNDHITKRGVNKVIFKDLSSRETSKKDVIEVSLNFLEYENVKISTAKSTSSSSSSKKTTAKTTSNSNLDDTYKSYLENDRGKSAKPEKTKKTPAQEKPPKVSPRGGTQNMLE